MTGALCPFDCLETPHVISGGKSSAGCRELDCSKFFLARVSRVSLVLRLQHVPGPGLGVSLYVSNQNEQKF